MAGEEAGKVAPINGNIGLVVNNCASFEKPSLAQRIYEPFRYNACKIFEYCVAGSFAPDVRDTLDFNDNTSTYGDPKDAAMTNAILSYIPIISSLYYLPHTDNYNAAGALAAATFVKTVETTFRLLQYHHGKNPRGTIVGEILSIPLRRVVKDRDVPLVEMLRT